MFLRLRHQFVASTTLEETVPVLSAHCTLLTVEGGDVDRVVGHTEAGSGT